MSLGITKVRFSPLAWAKMVALQQEIDYEFSMIGFVSETDPFLIEDFFCFKQEGTGVSTELDPVELGAACEAMDAAGIDVSRGKVWYHSHVNMQVYFSGTDVQTIEMLGSTGGDDAGYYLISVCSNKKMELSIRVDIWNPWRRSFVDLSYSIEHVLPDVSDWLEESKKKITRKATTFVARHSKKTYTTTYGSGYGSSYGGFPQIGPIPKGEGKGKGKDKGEVVHFRDGVAGLWTYDKNNQSVFKPIESKDPVVVRENPEITDWLSCPQCLEMKCENIERSDDEFTCRSCGTVGSADHFVVSIRDYMPGGSSVG